MENVVQVQRIIPAECLTGEPLLNSWRTEDLNIRQFSGCSGSGLAQPASQLWTVHLRRVGNCVGVAPCVPPANYVNNRERLRTQRSHSRSGRGMRCNTTWRAALAAQRHIPLMALPRRGRTGLRPIPLLQSIRWIHWFESRPPEMARTTVRLLRPTR